MPQKSNFRLPRGHWFRPKFDLTVMAPNHGRELLGSLVGPMGSHWSIKLGQNPKKLPCPKIGFFGYPAVIDFGQNLTVWLWCQIMVGTTYGPFWGQWGPIGAKKWVKTAKNCHAPKFEFSTTPRSSISAKIWPYGFGAKSRWGPPRVHLGANGVPLELKNGSKPQKIAMPQNSNFRLPRGHRFRPKFDLTIMAPNHARELLGSILGPLGSHWGKKLGQNPKNYHAPKFDFSAKIRPYGYGAKSWWGPPRVHLGANGVPLEQKNGLKP